MIKKYSVHLTEAVQTTETMSSVGMTTVMNFVNSLTAVHIYNKHAIHHFRSTGINNLFNIRSHEFKTIDDIFKRAETCNFAIDLINCSLNIRIELFEPDKNDKFFLIDIVFSIDGKWEKTSTSPIVKQ